MKTQWRMGMDIVKLLLAYGASRKVVRLKAYFSTIYWNQVFDEAETLLPKLMTVSFFFHNYI